MIGDIYQILNNQDTSVCTVTPQIKGPSLCNTDVCIALRRGAEDRNRTLKWHSWDFKLTEQHQRTKAMKRVCFQWHTVTVPFISIHNPEMQTCISHMEPCHSGSYLLITHRSVTAVDNKNCVYSNSVCEDASRGEGGRQAPRLRRMLLGSPDSRACRQLKGNGILQTRLTPELFTNAI